MSSLSFTNTTAWTGDLNPPAQVILDVGAQILELSNHDLAAHWLKLLPKASVLQTAKFAIVQHVQFDPGRRCRLCHLQIPPLGIWYWI
jgi:hypothetical protein